MIIEIPKHCPVCGSTLEWVKDQIFCRNTSCEAKVNKKIEHFCKVLNIKGLGPKSIEKLELTSIPELFFIEFNDIKDDIGEKVAIKILAEIEKAKTADLATVLASFSIPLIGDTAANKISSVVANIYEINSDKCKEAGLGDKASSNLLTWLNTEFLEMVDFLPFDWQSKKSIQTDNNKTVCITGKLKSYKTKSEAAEALAAKGYKYVDSITKTTKYLVDEQESGSSKREKAKEYNIPIINNLKTFLEEN